MISKIFHLLLFICFLFFTQNINAQSVVSGNLTDELSNEPLIGAYLKLVSQKDTTVHFGVSDYDGRFEITINENGNYNAEISYVGYETLKMTITVEENTDIGVIKVEVGSTALDEIEVIARQDRVTQREDTTQYNAAAYGTNPNATTEDLLQKMPGFVVSDGKMQVQGENITKILVNGKPFFGDDPDMALKNLPAEVISQIQVYDQSSEDEEAEGESSGGDGPKTINIILKEEYTNGFFGNAYGGYGLNDKYKAGGNVSYFQENRRVNILAQFNNINRQNFSSADLLGVSSKTGNKKRGGVNSKNFLVKKKGGINTTNAVGINYQDFLGDKIEVSGSYFFNQSDNVNETKLRRDFLNRTTTRYFEDVSNDESDNINHRVNARFKYKINDKNTVLVKPTLTIQDNTGISEGTTQTFSADTLTNALSDIFQSNLSALNFSNRLVYNRKFEKKRRSLQLNLRNNLSISNGETFTKSTNLTVGTEAPVLLDQNSILDNAKKSYSASIRYTEPFGKYIRITTGYTYGNERNESDILTSSLNEINETYDVLEENLSNRFNSDYQSHKGELTYQFKKRKLNYSIRGFYQSADLNNFQTFPAEAITTKSFRNLMPQASLRYNISKSKNIRANFKTRTRLPSANDLQDVVDNNNPLRVSAGNSDLTQAVDYSFDVKYSANNAEKGTVFFAFFKTSVSENYIGKSLTLLEEQDTIKNIILPAGAQFRTPINLDGYFRADAFMTFGMPLTQLKSNFNLNVGAKYRKTPSHFNGETIFTNTQSLRAGVVLSSNISENLDFTVKTTSFLNLAQNDNADNTQVFDQVTRATANWIFAKKWQINSNVTHRFFETFGAAPIDAYILWNASFGYKFMKNERAELGLTLYDILNSNISITQYYNTNSYTQKESLALTRFFMLTFRYNIRAF